MAAILLIPNGYGQFWIVRVDLMIIPHEMKSVAENKLIMWRLLRINKGHCNISTILCPWNCKIEINSGWPWHVYCYTCEHCRWNQAGHIYINNRKPKLRPEPKSTYKLLYYAWHPPPTQCIETAWSEQFQSPYSWVHGRISTTERKIIAHYLCRPDNTKLRETHGRVDRFYEPDSSVNIVSIYFRLQRTVYLVHSTLISGTVEERILGI